MILSVWAETTTLHVLRNHVTFLPGGPRRRDRAHYIEDVTLYVIGLFPHVAIKMRRGSTVPKFKHHRCQSSQNISLNCAESEK
jgi:hypothetical protein